MLRKRLQARVRKLLGHEAVTSTMLEAEISGIEEAWPRFSIVELLVLIGELIAMIIEWLKNRRSE